MPRQPRSTPAEQQTTNKQDKKRRARHFSDEEDDEEEADFTLLLLEEDDDSSSSESWMSKPKRRTSKKQKRSSASSAPVATKQNRRAANRAAAYRCRERKLAALEAAEVAIIDCLRQHAELQEQAAAVEQMVLRETAAVDALRRFVLSHSQYLGGDLPPDAASELNALLQDPVHPEAALLGWDTPGTDQTTPPGAAPGTLLDNTAQATAAAGRSPMQQQSGQAPPARPASGRGSRNASPQPMSVVKAAHARPASAIRKAAAAAPAAANKSAQQQQLQQQRQQQAREQLRDEHHSLHMELPALRVPSRQQQQQQQVLQHDDESEELHHHTMLLLEDPTFGAPPQRSPSPLLRQPQEHQAMQAGHHSRADDHHHVQHEAEEVGEEGLVMMAPFANLKMLAERAVLIASPRG